MPELSAEISTGNCYWRVLDPSSLLIEDLDNNTLCYNKESAETHFLNAFPAELLKLVISNPGTELELGKQLAQLCETPYNTDWQTSVNAVLLDLQRIHLINRVTP